MNASASAERAAGLIKRVVADDGTHATSSSSTTTEINQLASMSASASETRPTGLEDASVGAVLASITSPMQLFVGLCPRACMCAVVCASQFFLYEALRPEVVTSS